MDDNISKVPTSPLSRSSSTGSNASAISFVSEDLDAYKEYDHAPWDQRTPDVTDITQSKRVENQQVDDIADNE